MSYDEKYVKELRDEAAGWRTKLRELEAQNLFKDVEIEFAKRNITADPTWVEVAEGQSIKEAVDSLVEKHPNLAAAPSIPTQEEVITVTRPQAPRVMKPGAPNSETPAKPFAERTVGEIKKDPVARSKLRDLYRAQLAASSNQPNHEY